MKSQSPINIAMTLLLSLQLVLLRAEKGFPRFIGYQNFKNDLTKLVSSQTLAHVQLTSLSKVLTSCLTAIKNYWIKYCEETYEREGINYFWSIKNSTEILNKLKAKGFQAITISTYELSTLYITLPHDLIKNQLVDLIENTTRREEVLYLACNEERAFFASEEYKK